MKSSHPLPNSLEAERIVIGMMLMLSDNNDFACQMLSPEDFYTENNKKIFSALQKMYESNQNAEMNLLAQNLADSQHLEEVGGVDYIRNCLDYVTHSYDFDAYTSIIKEKSMQREFILYFHQTINDINLGQKNINDLIGEAQEKLFQISKKQTKLSCVRMGDIISGKASKEGLSFLQIMQKRQEAREQSNYKGFLGISTGINSLDIAINGLGKGNLIIMAARPGVGKTAFLCHMCVEIGVKNKIPVGIFTLEMAPEQIIERLVSNYCDIPQERITRGDLDEEFVEMSTLMVDIKEAPIIYYDGMNVNINSLTVGAKRMKDLFDIQVLFIDYLQLLEGSAKFKNSDNRVNEVSEISRKLKLLSRELNIPIICLSQLNRNVEGRLIKEPMLSDLRDSGSIEQDADVVILLNRPEMYDSSKRPGIITADVCKNRHGAPAKLDLCMEKQFGRIRDFTEALNEDVNQSRILSEAF